MSAAVPAVSLSVRIVPSEIGGLDDSFRALIGRRPDQCYSVYCSECLRDSMSQRKEGQLLDYAS